MTKSPSIVIKTLLTLAIAGSMAAFIAQPADAQTAKKLKCNGCVKSKQLKNGGVKNADLGTNSVNSQKIIDGGVGSADLADDSVNTAKVQDNSLTAADLAPNSVGSSEVTNNSLTANDLATNSVGAAEIATSAVGSSEVATNSVPATDLSNEPGVEFLNDNGFGTDISITSTYAVMRSLSVSAPSSGFVTCIASGQADWDVLNLSRSMDLGWDNTGGTTTPDSFNFVQHNNTGTLDTRIPITAMHTFSVGTGTTTFSLKARCSSCAVGDLDFTFHNAACMFFPSRY